MGRAIAGRARQVGIVTLALVAAFALALGNRSIPPRESEASAPTSPAAGALAGRFPHFGRVAVLVLENREYEQVIGSHNAPFLNALARRYALATRYYAIGHPSVPNYLALTGGSTFEIHHDCNRCEAEAPSIISQLDSAGISWKAYFEGLPRTGYLGRRDERYTKHFNPFVYYEGVRGQAADRTRIVPLGRLGADLRYRRLPRFMWIAPDLCHDSHNCSVRSSDRYAATLVPAILPALGPRGLLFLTWDEGTTRAGPRGRAGGGHVALIAAGPAARKGTATATVANHYSLLRTIEAGFDLPALKRAGAPSTPLLTALLRAPAGVANRHGERSRWAQS